MFLLALSVLDCLFHACVSVIRSSVIVEAGRGGTVIHSSGWPGPVHGRSLKQGNSS